MHYCTATQTLRIVIRTVFLIASMGCGATGSESRLNCWRRNAPGMHHLTHRDHTTALPGKSWHVFDPACRTEYMLDTGLNSPLNSPPLSSSPGILFLGDSIDALNMYELCEELNSTDWNPGSRSAEPDDGKYNHHYQQINYCITPSGFRVATFFICGMSYSGPNWQGQTLPPDTRVDMAVKEWDQIAPAKEGSAPIIDGPPSLVILSSNLWDLAGAYLRAEFVPISKTLSDAWLDSWMTNATGLVQKIKSAFPQETAIVFKTTAPPVNKAQQAKDLARQQGGTQPGPELDDSRHHESVQPDFLSSTASRQINAAGRAVALANGLLILDAEAMSSWLTPHTYLRDGSHPSRMFALEVGNLALNMVKDVLD